MIIVIDHILRETFTFCEWSGPNCVQVRKRGSSVHGNYFRFTCKWVFKRYWVCFISMLIVLWSKSSNLSLCSERSQRPSRVLVAQVLHILISCSMSQEKCEAEHIKVKLYGLCFLKEKKKSIQTWETKILSWRKLKDKGKSLKISLKCGIMANPVQK